MLAERIVHLFRPGNTGAVRTIEVGIFIDVYTLDEFSGELKHIAKPALGVESVGPGASQPRCPFYLSLDNNKVTARQEVLFLDVMFNCHQLLAETLSKNADLSFTTGHTKL